MKRLDLTEIRAYVGTVAAQLTEARALIKAIEALAAVGCCEIEREALEKRLACVFRFFPAPSTYLLSVDFEPFDGRLLEQEEYQPLSAADVFGKDD